MTSFHCHYNNNIVVTKLCIHVCNNYHYCCVYLGLAYSRSITISFSQDNIRLVTCILRQTYRDTVHMYICAGFTYGAPIYKQTSSSYCYNY